MYFVPHFGHAEVYETSIWTPCFQILAKTMLDGTCKISCLNVEFELGFSYFSIWNSVEDKKKERNYFGKYYKKSCTNMFSWRHLIALILL